MKLFSLLIVGLIIDFASGQNGKEVLRYYSKEINQTDVSYYCSVMKSDKGYSSGTVADINHSDGDVFYQALLSLTSEQYAYLIRTAIAGKSENKNPQYGTDCVIYKVAQAAGLNIARVEQD